MKFMKWAVLSAVLCFLAASHYLMGSGVLSGAVCPGGAANTIQKSNGTVCVASSITDNGTTVSTTEPVNIGVGSGIPGQISTQFYNNDGATGTLLNGLVKFSAANTVIRSATTDTDGAIGICRATCGTAGTATVVYSGAALCVFDGATTAGHWSVISPTTAGNCHDTGSASRPTTAEGIGIVTTTNGGGGSYYVTLALTSPAGSAAGSITIGTTTVVGGTNTDCLFDNAGVVGNQACGAGGGGPNVTSGTFSSLPGTCTHTATQSDLYYFTNSWWINTVCTATNTWSYWGQNGFGTPAGPAAGWTLVNTASNCGSGASVCIAISDDSAGDVYLNINNNASLNWRIADKSTPGTPYTIDTYIRASQAMASTDAAGVYFYDGTKLMGLEMLGQGTGNNAPFLRVEKITNVTTDNSTAASNRVSATGETSNGTYVGPLFGGICLRLANDGSTLTFAYSLDCRNYNTLFSEPVGTFITPTNYGFGGLSFLSNTGQTGTPFVGLWVPEVYVH